MARWDHAENFNSSVLMQELFLLAYLLILFLISILTTVWYFKRYSLKLLCCWACQNNQFVKNYLKNQWTCGSCGNYNGFNKDGDYNKEIKEQYCSNEQEANDLLVRFTQRTSHEHSPFSMSGHLCDSCNKSEAIKMKLLRKFENLDEDSFIKNSKEIERLYPLCSLCQYTVQKEIKKLDREVANYNQKSVQKKDLLEKKFYASKLMSEDVKRRHSKMKDYNSNNTNLNTNASDFIDNNDLSSSFKSKINFSGNEMNSNNNKNKNSMTFSHSSLNDDKTPNHKGIENKLNLSTISPISRISSPSNNQSISSFSTDHRYPFLTIPVFLQTFLLFSSVVVSIFSFIPVRNSTLHSSFIFNESHVPNISSYYNFSNYYIGFYNILDQFYNFYSDNVSMNATSYGINGTSNKNVSKNDNMLCFKNNNAEDFFNLFNTKNHREKYVLVNSYESKLENRTNYENQENFSILNYLIYFNLPSTLLFLNFLHHTSSNFWKCKEASILSFLWLSLLFFSPSLQYECCTNNSDKKCVKIYSFLKNFTIDESFFHCSQQNDLTLVYLAPFISYLCSILHLFSLIKYFNQKSRTSLNIWNKSYKLQGNVSKIHLETSFIQHHSNNSHDRTFRAFNNSKKPVLQHNLSENKYFTPKAVKNQRLNHSSTNGNINRSPLSSQNHFSNVTTLYHMNYHSPYSSSDLNNDFFERFSCVSNQRRDAIYRHSCTNSNMFSTPINNGAVASSNLHYKNHAVRPIITPSKFNLQNQTPLSF